MFKRLGCVCGVSSSSSTFSSSLRFLGFLQGTRAGSNHHHNKPTGLLSDSPSLSSCWCPPRTAFFLFLSETMPSGFTLLPDQIFHGQTMAFLAHCLIIISLRSVKVTLAFLQPNLKGPQSLCFKCFCPLTTGAYRLCK